LNKFVYIAAKHDIVGLTKTVPLECTEQCFEFEQAKYNLVTAKQSLHEMIDPRRISEFILLICGNSSHSITGSPLSIGGDWTTQ